MHTSRLPTHDPIDVALAFYTAVRHGDRDLDDLLGDTFVFEPDALLSDGGAVTSLSDWFIWLARRYPTHRAKMREFQRLPDGRVLAIGTVDLHGPHGGFGSLASWIFEVRHGRIVRLELLLDQTRARRRAGLRPLDWPGVSRFTTAGRPRALAAA